MKRTIQIICIICLLICNSSSDSYAFFSFNKPKMGLYDITLSTSVEEFVEIGVKKGFRIVLFKQNFPSKYSEFIEDIKRKNYPINFYTGWGLSSLVSKKFPIDDNTTWTYPFSIYNLYYILVFDKIGNNNPPKKSILPECKYNYFDIGKKFRLLRDENEKDFDNKFFFISLTRHDFDDIDRFDDISVEINAVFFREDDSEDFKIAYFIVRLFRKEIKYEAINVLNERYGEPSVGKKYETHKNVLHILSDENALYWNVGDDFAVTTVVQGKFEKDKRDYTKLVIFYNCDMLNNFLEYVNDEYDVVSRKRQEIENAIKNKAKELERARNRMGM